MKPFFGVKRLGWYKIRSNDLIIDTSNLSSREYVVNNIVDTCHFATREYVDNIVCESSNLATTEYVDSFDTSILATRKYADNAISDLPTADDVIHHWGECLSESGDFLACNLSLMGYSITRLSDPPRHRDAVQKAHVDTQRRSKHEGKMFRDLQMNGRLSGYLQ